MTLPKPNLLSQGKETKEKKKSKTIRFGVIVLPEKGAYFNLFSTCIKQVSNKILYASVEFLLTGYTIVIISIDSTVSH